MTSASRTTTAAAAATALLLAVSGCGDQVSTGSGGGTTPWPATSTPLPTDVVTWAQTQVVFVGEEHPLYTGVPIEAFVVAGDSAWVVGDGSDALLRVSDDGVDDTGSHADPDSLLASPDGRYLGFLDPDSGRPDRYDTRRLEAVVVDLQTGREVLRSSRGMGDLVEDDLADLYEDASYAFVALTDDTAYVAPPAGDPWAVDLATGEVRDVASDGVTGAATSYGDDLANADGTWSIQAGDNSDRARFVSADGQQVQPADPSRSLLLDRWVDATTAVGLASDARLVTGQQDPETVVRLVTCTVPTGACEQVGAASGPRGDLLLPHTTRTGVPPGM